MKRWVQIVVWMAGVAAVVVGLSVNRESTPSNPTLSHEERVVVLEILDRVELKFPELRDEATQFRGKVSDLHQEIILERAFLESDSVTQEQTLVNYLSLPPGPISYIKN